jgi:prophage regulatory protein
MEEFLRRAAVERATGLKRSSIYELIAREQFPRPIKISAATGQRGGAVAWARSEIAQWQADCIARREREKKPLTSAVELNQSAENGGERISRRTA